MVDTRQSTRMVRLPGAEDFMERLLALGARQMHQARVDPSAEKEAEDAEDASVKETATEPTQTN